MADDEKLTLKNSPCNSEDIDNADSTPADSVSEELPNDKGHASVIDDAPPSDKEKSAESDFSDSESASGSRVELDLDDFHLDDEILAESDSSGGSSASSSKVELDLDDAPFLQEEEVEEEPENVPATGEDGQVSLQAEDTAPVPPLKRIQSALKNKKILGAVLGGVFLIVALLVFLLSGSKDLPPEPEPEQKLATNASSAEEQKPAEFMISWEPFWVEQKDSEGEIRFVICQFSAPTINEILKREAESKKVIIRDGIFYYLSQKPLTFLSAAKDSETLKTELLGVINSFLTQGQLDQLLIENYLVK